jgi:hypothetical protein
MILYHGSNIEIEKINLDKCRPFKDFGRGFYTTTLKDQAWSMADRTVRIFKKGFPFVTEFTIDDELINNTRFNKKYFTQPDINWARFVMNNRNEYYKDIDNPDCNTDCKYDMVFGPVANDDISALMDVYLSGIISDDALIKELIFRELNNQISFHTERIITCLCKTGVYSG